MDQDVANKISKDGALFILENLPLQSEFGIDCKSYQIGEKFQGLKMIPKGLHFIYFSVMSKDGQLSPRTGFFHYFELRESLIKQFDAKSEEFSIESPSNDQINKYKVENLPFFDDTLGPYPFEQYKQWISLTDFISSELIAKVNTDSKLIRSVSAIIPKQFVSKKNQMECDNSLNDANDLNFKMDPKNLLKFTSIEQLQAYPLDSTPEQITKNKIDNSFLLEQLIAHHQGNIDCVLGELQIAFVVFLIGQNYEAFEQWKKLFQLICKSCTAMQSRAQFFIDFIRVIYFQLKEVPADTFVDILENCNFLLNCLRDFFLNIYNQDDLLDAGLINKCKQFEHYLTNQYSWEFNIEPDDEAPVIVQLDE